MTRVVFILRCNNANIRTFFSKELLFIKKKVIIANLKTFFNRIELYLSFVSDGNNFETRVLVYYFSIRIGST